MLINNNLTKIEIKPNTNCWLTVVKITVVNNGIQLVEFVSEIDFIHLLIKI